MNVKQPTKQPTNQPTNQAWPDTQNQMGPLLEDMI